MRRYDDAGRRRELRAEERERRKANRENRGKRAPAAGPVLL
jgi:hypothetical protein